MKRTHLLSIVVLLLMIMNCAAPITVTKAPTRKLDSYLNMEILDLQNEIIGDINKNIINEIMQNAVEDIITLNRFEKIAVPENFVLPDKRYASNIVDKTDLLNDANKTVQLKVILIKYKKGNAFLRFLFGTLAGSGSVTCELIALDMDSGEELIIAETTAQIAGSFASEQNVVGPIYRAIVKFVKDNFTS